MQKHLFFLFTLFSCTLAFSQTVAVTDDDYVNDNVLRYDDFIYKPTIKTVQIHESSWDYAAPIINLNSGEQIELSFDDLDSDQKRYTVTFVHCNADWTPSDLMVSEYLSGYFDLNFINFSYSMNTLQKYTHYSLLFPTQSLTFTKSGNYVAYVYVNNKKEDLVLSRRILVYDNKVSVAHTFRQTSGDDDQFAKQHIDFNIGYAGYDITNPFNDLKVTITQNNRWDNAVTNIKPTFLGNNQLTYSLDDASTFTGGKEFRYFDIRSMKFFTEKVKEIYRDENLKNHIVLYPEEIRSTKPYLYYPDFNGSFLIKNRDSNGNQDIESDYIYVDFFLPYSTPETGGNFYILGKLTDWRMNKKSKMTYNYKRFGYEAQLYLKQGYYNYEIVLSSDTKKGGDETVLDGSHWETENDYNILVYHRKLGTYYDQLIGYKKINSLRK